MSKCLMRCRDRGRVIELWIVTTGMTCVGLVLFHWSVSRVSDGTKAGLECCAGRSAVEMSVFGDPIPLTMVSHEGSRECRPPAGPRVRMRGNGVLCFLWVPACAGMTWGCRSGG